MNRPQGLPLKTMLAAVVDPRTTHTPFFSTGDKGKIKDALKTYMLEHVAKFGDTTVVVPFADDATDSDDSEDNMDDAEDMFEGINAAPPTLPPAPVAPVLVSSRVDAEIASFYAEGPLTMQRKMGGRKVYNNPLDWWRLNDKKYPILAQVAKTLLCIPATSAPSERLFSTAGLTIANNRARMTGDHAAQLIFLHEAIPLLNSLS